jgi:hypothetical protein
MKVRIEAECTPEEARAFLGLPDVAPVNQLLMQEVMNRVQKNAALLDVEPMMRNWMALGGQAQDALFKMVSQAVSTAARTTEPKK